jgi:hypothetical protein
MIGLHSALAALLIGFGVPAARGGFPVGRATPVLGAHMIIGNEGDLEALQASIPKLAEAGLNKIVLEIGFNYQFKSRPEMFSESGVTFAGARKFSAVCKQYKVSVVPEIDCLGHQSWAADTGALLKVHPELDETPGQYPGNKGIYCRSWCPLHPELGSIVYPLIDELIEAFEAKEFHCGMDEVFIIGSQFCTRCAGKNPAELFAKQVNSLHDHLKKKHIGMMIWADRLLDGKATGYGEWEAAINGTEAALDMIPKDIVLCDWHYEKRPDHPSLKLFVDHGFAVWPCTWRDATAAASFSKEAKGMKSPKVAGVLVSTWGAVRANALATWPPLAAAFGPWMP